MGIGRLGRDLGCGERSGETERLWGARSPPGTCPLGPRRGRPERAAAERRCRPPPRSRCGAASAGGAASHPRRPSSRHGLRLSAPCWSVRARVPFPLPGVSWRDPREAPVSVYTYSPAGERRRWPCSTSLLYFQPEKSRGCCSPWSQSGPGFCRLGTETVLPLVHFLWNPALWAMSRALDWGRGNRKKESGVEETEGPVCG